MDGVHPVPGRTSTLPEIRLDPAGTVTGTVTDAPLSTVDGVADRRAATPVHVVATPIMIGTTPIVIDF